MRKPYGRWSTSLRLHMTALTLASALLGLAAAAQDAPAPKKQLPADQRAYAAAHGIKDPAGKLAALRQFVKDYPDSSRVRTAQGVIFETLVKNFPDRADEIGKQAELQVKAAGSGFSKCREESQVAYRLADAGTNGVDLPLAEKLGRDSVKHMNEQEFDRSVLDSYAKQKITAPDAGKLHTMYAHQRAEVLAPLAGVYLEQGKQADAIPLLDEGFALDPTEDDINAFRGRVALAQGRNAEALLDFERAVLVGNPVRRDRASMMTLYKAQHGGSDAGLDAELDTQYARMFPEGFTPPRQNVASGGHTALLELFTGSGCPPCVAGDLAVEGMLEAYPRQELVALAFDEHIPEPDPLANPDSIARAGVYDVHSTPSYVLDGRKLPIYGGARADAESLYGKLNAYVVPDVTLPTGASLELTASRDADGAVHAQASVKLADSATLLADANKIASAEDAAQAAADAAEAAGHPHAAPKPDKPGAPAAATPLPAKTAPRYVVNFALVEDDVRYSGENGVRFHRMVVRALAKPAGEGFLADPGASTSAEASFDPATISTKWAAYLDDFSRTSERFGEFKFLSTDTSMQPAHLAVVAWVQDATTHRVLDSAFVHVSAPAAVPGVVAGGQ